jgi:hypothetical protein
MRRRRKYQFWKQEGDQNIDPWFNVKYYFCISLKRLSYSINLDRQQKVLKPPSTFFPTGDDRGVPDIRRFGHDQCHLRHSIACIGGKRGKMLGRADGGD